jgi:hypothetical protein
LSHRKKGLDLGMEKAKYEFMQELGIAPNQGQKNMKVYPVSKKDKYSQDNK